jgi:hypothetical protein
VKDETRVPASDRAAEPLPVNIGKQERERGRIGKRQLAELVISPAPLELHLTCLVRVIDVGVFDADVLGT